MIREIHKNDMAKVILICGKICVGKTVYAKKLIKESSAVLLSCDELISALFHPDENEYHDRVINSVQGFLMKKSLEIISSGASVILDWGFWTKESRKSISDFYKENGVQFEWYYIDIDDEQWRKNIASRNEAVLKNETTDYYVDSVLLKKLEGLFEILEKEEMGNIGS